MPIYEYYCPDNHRIYQFYARTLAQGRTVPPCPDNPRFRMRKILSPFAVVGSGGEKAGDGAGSGAPGGGSDPASDPRMEAAIDRKSTRLNSSHLVNSYTAFSFK